MGQVEVVGRVKVGENRQRWVGQAEVGGALRGGWGTQRLNVQGRVPIPS